MPAAAVARRTPSIGGMSGKRAGASGETAVAIGRGPNGRGPKKSWPGRPGHDDEVDRADAVNRLLFLLLGLGGLRRFVEAFDLGGGAQLGDKLDLRLALDIALELALDLVEIRRLPLALVLDLENVPAELSLDRIGDLAFVELEGDRREFRHHLVLGEVAEIAAVLATR